MVQIGRPGVQYGEYGAIGPANAAGNKALAPAVTPPALAIAPVVPAHAVTPPALAMAPPGPAIVTGMPPSPGYGPKYCPAAMLHSAVNPIAVTNASVSTILTLDHDFRLVVKLTPL
jgi:hypothetical protein